jgi:hypothetical protein
MAFTTNFLSLMNQSPGKALVAWTSRLNESAASGGVVMGVASEDDRNADIHSKDSTKIFTLVKS